jgi:hypothetical protein
MEETLSLVRKPSMLEAEESNSLRTLRLLLLLVNMSVV